MHRTTPLISSLCLILAAACAPGAGGIPAGTSPAGGARSSDIDVDNAAAADIALTVFAAASLNQAFRAIGAGFEAEHPGVRVRFNFAGSQQLATQIGEGAPADVFASANAKQMDAAIRAGEVAEGTPRTFARNRLVVVHPADNPAGLRDLADIARPGIKLVLAAKAVPAGGYALEFLRKASTRPAFTAAYSPTVLANVVSYEEDVSGVLAKVAIGEADAGIVYTSDLRTAAAGEVGHIDIPDDLNVVAAYPIAPVARSQHPEMAEAFVAYVLSAAGRGALVEHGFIAPE